MLQKKTQRSSKAQRSNTTTTPTVLQWCHKCRLKTHSTNQVNLIKNKICKCFDNDK